MLPTVGAGSIWSGRIKKDHSSETLACVPLKAQMATGQVPGGLRPGEAPEGGALLWGYGDPLKLPISPRGAGGHLEGLDDAVIIGRQVHQLPRVKAWWMPIRREDDGLR